MGLWPCVSNDGIRPSRCVRGTCCKNRKRVAAPVSSSRMIADWELWIADCDGTAGSGNCRLLNAAMETFVAAAIFVGDTSMMERLLQLATGLRPRSRDRKPAPQCRKSRPNAERKGLHGPSRAPPMTVLAPAPSETGKRWKQFLGDEQSRQMATSMAWRAMPQAPR